jgi:transposase InsO family protein
LSTAWPLAIHHVRKAAVKLSPAPIVSTTGVPTTETKEQARREVARFIDAYNQRRRHSSCEMLPPVAYEQLLAERATEAAREHRAA